MLSALIAAVAIALAARRFFERHLSGFAVFKALGCRQRQIARALMLEMLWVALIGSLAGAVVGFGAHWLLVGLAGSLVEMTLPVPRLVPVGQAILAGIVLVTGFAVLPILRLADVPPLRVLRRELSPPAPSTWLAIAMAVIGPTPGIDPVCRPRSSARESPCIRARSTRSPTATSTSRRAQRRCSNG